MKNWEYLFSCDSTAGACCPPYDYTLRFFPELRVRAALQLEILALRHPARRLAAAREATEADRFGRAAVGVAVIHLAGLAIGSDHRHN